MTREEHQPWSENPQRPQRTPEDFQETCGDTIGFVLALGEQPGDIEHAVAEARKAKLAAVYVLTRSAFTAKAAEAEAALGGKGRTLVRSLEYDPAEAVKLTRGAGNFELFSQLPFGLLETMREICESLSDTYTSAIVLDAAQDHITADHIYELIEDAREHPQAEVVVSWIQWLRRMPCVVTRPFLERVGAHDPQLLGQLGAVKIGQAAPKRPVPFIRTRDHVFGEEKLAPAPAPRKQAEAFLKACTMSALEAVQLARYAEAHPDETLYSPNQPLSLLGPTKSEPLNSADSALVQSALNLRKMMASLPESERAELAWADEFGRRNKRDFPLLNDRKHAGRFAYLDSAATTQRVDLALRAQHDYDLHENANVYRGAYELSAQSTFTFNDARKRLEDFIGAKRRETVFTANTTGAINLVAQAWGEHNIGEGDLIVCELAAHHSAALPFAMLAERKGARVEYVPYDADGRLDREAFEALLAQKPKLVCLAHIGNVFGIEAPVKQLAADAHEVGARVLLDAAQSFSHVKIDVRDLGVDWVAMSAHKAYGPMGLGALWISPDAFAEMDPLGGGGGVVSHVSTESYYLRPLALQYEMGTPPVSQAVGWAAAIDYLDGLGLENVARHAAALTRYAVRGLQSIDGVDVLGDHAQLDGQTGLVSFSVRSVAPADTAKFLGALDVAIRSGGHCALPLHAALGMIGTGRISVGVHTTRDDIDAAIVAIALCRQAYES